MKQSPRASHIPTRSVLSHLLCHCPVSQMKVRELAQGQVPVNGKVKAHTDIWVIPESGSDSLRRACPPRSTRRRALTTCQRPRQAGPDPWRDSGVETPACAAGRTRGPASVGTHPWGEEHSEKSAFQGCLAGSAGAAYDSGCRHEESSSTLANR